VIPISEVDRDDDFSDESDEPAKLSKNELKDFTFLPGKKPEDNKGHTFLAKSMNAEVDMSKLSSIEKIREYLSAELGDQLLIKVYPIIKEFGDDILFTDKIPLLKEKLEHLLSGEQVDRLHIYFSTLVFYELEMEKTKTQKKEDYNPEGMLNVVNVFKDVSTTACFGNVTIGKRR